MCLLSRSHSATSVKRCAALAGSGFVVADNERDHVTAVTWVTSKWGDRAPNDRVLFRAFVGGARDPEAIHRGDDVLIRNVKDDFRRYMQITEPPLGVRVFRWPHAGVQLEVGHLNLMSDIDARLGSVPGLFVSGAGF
jgi:protoporphyrinogen/coproporphyrinogen III oxidase